MEPALAWMNGKSGHINYSMQNRLGPTSYDCSSTVYYSLIAASIFPIGMRIGNTDTLFGDLERYGFSQLAPNAQGNYDTRRGDIFIWGVRGQSGGAAGHTGEFEDADNVISNSYYYNGMHINNYDYYHSVNNNPVQTFYRYTGKPSTPPVEPVDQTINPGSIIEFPGVYEVTAIQDIADVWQAQSDDLLPGGGFEWGDNGIPCAPLVEVYADGYATNDQELAPGSLFVIPGKYQVLDVGASGDRWLGQIAWNDFKFWVDLEPVREISSSDGGTPTPGPRPTTTTTETTHAPIPTTTTSTTQGITTTSTTTQSGPGPEPTTTTTTLVVPPFTTTSTTVPPVPPVGFWAYLLYLIQRLLNRS